MRPTRANVDPEAKKLQPSTAGQLRTFGGDIFDALDTVGVPSYVIDPTGVIRWLNPAARRLIGDARGRQSPSVLAREEVRRGRDVFAQKGTGSHRHTDVEGILISADGSRIKVELSAVTLEDDHRIIGVFG